MIVWDVYDSRGRWVWSAFNAGHAWGFANYALIVRGNVQARLV